MTQVTGTPPSGRGGYRRSPSVELPTAVSSDGPTPRKGPRHGEFVRVFEVRSRG